MYGGYPPPRRRLFVIIGGAVALLVVVGAALVLTSGSGGDDDDADTKSTEPEANVTSDDPLTAYLMAFAKRATGNTIDDNQASCMATNVIDVFGRDRLVEADFMQIDNPLTVLTPEDAEKWIKTSYDCLDEDELVEAMAATWNPERFGGLPDEIAPCIYKGWIQGWGRTRSIEIFGKLANPEQSPDPATILTKQENDLMTEVIAGCNATLQSATTAAG
jgi:hypothetical protein